MVLLGVLVIKGVVASVASIDVELDNGLLDEVMEVVHVSVHGHVELITDLSPPHLLYAEMRGHPRDGWYWYREGEVL